MTHENVKPITETASGGWFGHLEAGPALGNYIDTALMLIFGGIPWQVKLFTLLHAITCYLQ